MNKEDYEKDLKKRQEEHLKQVNNSKTDWKPCLHDECSECHGTGIKLNGGVCFHFISCSCPKCTVYCSATTHSVVNHLQMISNNSRLTIRPYEDSGLCL